MKSYKVVSLTHKELSLNNLGKYIIKEDPEGGTNTLADKLHKLKENFGMEELCYLSTCNRVAYVFTGDIKVDTDFLQRFLQFINPLLSEAELFSSAGLAKVYEGKGAIRHLHEVAASLDSLVIGEREILRQLRVAYERSNEMGLTGDNLRLAFKFIVPAAKKIYTETQIGEKPVSIVSLAARKLRAFLESHPHFAKDGRFVMIGAGETNQLMAKFLKGDGISNVTVFNRGVENGTKVATQLNGRYLKLEQLAEYKEGFDVLISCTGATNAIVDTKLLKSLVNGETSSKLIIDLAIPQDIHPDAISYATDARLTYVGIEELRSIAEQNLAFRRSELEKAHALLDGYLGEFEMAYERRQLEKAFSGLPSQVKAIRERAVTQVFSKELEQIDPESRELLDKMMDYMESKFIGLPIATARAAIVAKNRA